MGIRDWDKKIDGKIRNINEHLRKSETYKSGRDKDFALKTVNRDLADLKEYNRKSGRDKQMERAWRDVGKSVSDLGNMFSGKGKGKKPW